MSTKKRSGAGSGGGEKVPGPDTFDFDEYISGKATFPEFVHTVYLDQDSGMALAKTADEYTELTEKGKDLLRRQRALKESSIAALVDDDAEEIAEQLNEVQEKTSALEAHMSELEDKVKKSGLTLTFQVGNVEKLGSVDTCAEREFVKAHGKGSSQDMEYTTRKVNYVLASRMEAYCTKITLPDGTEKNPPAREGFTKLLDSLISGESVRLVNRLNEYLDSSSDWAEKIDAGFPGRGTDLALSAMGGAGTEDGEVVGDTPGGDVDRGGI